MSELDHIGPKHHAVVIGRDAANNQVYVAENMHYGYQLATYENFVERYSHNHYQLFRLRAFASWKYAVA